jgi:putative endonuclease
MTDPRHRIGRDAEEAVARWLVDAGWTIIGRRVRARGGGEVDLLARDPHGVLVGVEVRARTTVRAGRAADTVDRRRVGRIARTLVAIASGWQGHTGLRIDLVTVEPVMPGRDRWRLRRVPGIGDP